MRRLFVYGTLMRGEPNHRVLGEARFERVAWTRDRFALRDLGAFPALTRGDVGSVFGEVFSIDRQTLARCDLLEGHPHHYRRQTVTLLGARWRCRGTESVLAYVYAQPPCGLIIPSGSWRERGRR